MGPSSMRTSVLRWAWLLSLPACMTGEPAAPEADSGGPVGAVRVLGALPAGECDARLLASRAGDRCSLVAVRDTAGTGPGARQSVTAADGSSCTVWNSGAGAPQTLTLDLGDEVTLSGLVLVPEMTPDGPAHHVIKISTDGVSFQSAGAVSGAMASGVAYELTLPQPIRARFVRVITARSPSWVAWREVVPLACD